MRKVLYGFGAAILLIVVTFGGVIGFALSMSSGLDEESKAYVEEALSAIAANWDGQKLLERSSAELRDLAKPDEVRTFFISLSRLGTMVEYQGGDGTGEHGLFHRHRDEHHRGLCRDGQVPEWRGDIPHRPGEARGALVPA